MRDKCCSFVVVAVDWLPRIKNSCFFGKLGLVEKQDSQDIDEKIASWHMLRGQVDKIPNLSGLKEIPIEKVLETKDFQSLRVVVDGPPGIGKTTLCRKLLNMWSNGTLHQQQYDLVLYCPLRNRKIATANTLAELLKAVYESPKVPEVDAWLSDREGKGLLIIFDGWDELDAQSRESSLAASLFRRELLNYCAVIITSRSYASSSLLEMDTHSKHVQVIGFSEEEVNIVIINTLQKDSKLAQELLVRMKEYRAGKSFSTIESKDSQLAVQLVNQLKIRTDVKSLCYIPLVCSMVIFVYKKEKKLPNTLTRLYETFILLTIKRHIKKRHSDIEYKRILSLNNLPSLVEQSFQEMCRLAYTSLKNENNKMTFFSDQLQEYSLSEAANEDYLGLMTSFEDDEEWYQFIHLSIQEFLAAWWMAKHEKTEEVFKTHFDDDHFRMCLRFVAGLTHLEHESYQQYFNKQLDLRCKTEPLFGFHALHDSCFISNPMRTEHIKSIYFDEFPIFLLQLLYESQNTALCEVLAQSFKDSSLCLYGVQLSSFDMMCLSFFIDNSNIAWNHLDLLCLVDGQKISIFIDGLTNQTTTSCKKCEIEFVATRKEEIVSLLQPSHLLHNIEEFYFSGDYIPFCTFSLPKIKVLHIEATLSRDDDASGCSKLEKCIESNTTLQELNIGLDFFFESDNNALLDCYNSVIKSTLGVIKGLTRNKSITSFSLILLNMFLSPERIPGGVIVDLLKYNKTLKALSLSGSIFYCSPSLNIEEVNTSLTALYIHSEMLASLLPHINGLQHLTLYDPLPPELIPPSLQTLELELNGKSATTELLNILQSNTTLKGLKVSMKDETSTKNRFGISLQDMLTHNQTLQYLHIRIMDRAYMPFLITGLKNNTSLQQLTVPVRLYPDDDDQLRTFFNVISQKSNLTELGMTLDFVSLHRLIKFQEMEQHMKFYEQVLSAVTSMLQSHTTMRLLDLKYNIIISINGIDKTIHILRHHMCTDQFRKFYKTIFNHSSLEYVSIANEVILEETFKEQEKARLQEEASQ